VLHRHAWPNTRCSSWQLKKWARRGDRRPRARLATPTRMRRPPPVPSGEEKEAAAEVGPAGRTRGLLLFEPPALSEPPVFERARS
jgi:hypothetical protein